LPGMANMSGAQRMQIERYDLGVTRDRLFSTGATGRRFLIAYTVVALVVLAALTYAAIDAFEVSKHAIVVVDLLVVFFGIAAWVYPNRKHV
jgi:hypothetical protein